jgi:hypothetical protein
VQRLKALGFGIVTTGRAAASWPRTIRLAGRLQHPKPVEASTRAATPCWPWARACAATRR